MNDDIKGPQISLNLTKQLKLDDEENAKEVGQGGWPWEVVLYIFYKLCNFYLFMYLYFI
jgi:hypothetical protein